MAIPLGGHPQVLFAAIGRRRRKRSEWQREYSNDAWIEMLERYKPCPAEMDEAHW